MAEDKSEFNMAISFLNTLRYLFNCADECSAKLDVHGWFHVLLSIRRELSDDMSPEQLKEANHYKDALQPKIQSFVNRQSSPLRHIKTGVPTELYNELDEFDMFLRKIMATKGYKSKMQEDLLKPEGDWGD